MHTLCTCLENAICCGTEVTCWWWTCLFETCRG